MRRTVLMLSLILSLLLAACGAETGAKDGGPGASSAPVAASATAPAATPDPGETPVPEDGAQPMPGGAVEPTPEATAAPSVAPAPTATPQAPAPASAAPTPSAAPVETSAAPVAGGEDMTAEEAHRRIESGDPVVVLDVGTAQHYAEQHIPGAMLVPGKDLNSVFPSALPVLDTEILVCGPDGSSAEAARQLRALGYTNVSDFGSVDSWPYDIAKGAYQAPAKAGSLTSFLSHDLDGLPVGEELFKGYDLTMINIWATFCGPCLREMPDLGGLAVEYADRGVQIVGIVADVYMDADGTYYPDMVATARELVAQTGANYPHLLPSDDLYAAKLNRVSAVPETIFVDSSGNLVGESYIGARSGADWKAIIESLLLEVGE